jgi:hypothetical protein
MNMKEESKEANDFNSKDDDKDIKVNEKDLAQEEKKRHKEASIQSISISLRGGALHSLHLPWPRPMQLNQSKKGWNPSRACSRHCWRRACSIYASARAFGPDPVVRETRAGQQQ